MIIVKNVLKHYIISTITMIIIAPLLILWIDLTHPVESSVSRYLSIALLISYIFLHELTHYFTAYYFNRDVKIRFYPRLFALTIDYSRLSFKQWFYSWISPQILIGFPLITLTMIFSLKELLELTVFHFTLSIGDYVSIAIIAFDSIKYGKPRTVYILYDEENNISGTIVEYMNNTLTIYLLE